ncbi:helix-turn-helix domain-containing protein [Lactococcus petauri]|uniref:helix-turn-helix domain-containing protein n=1 Tax=Lactococcus petauri TaxID=1940789 RepID=UPI001F582213|nr:helix-turn-helix domain-containing protein [Lactococcus petauri]
MIELGNEISTKLREKRARKKITLLEASKEIGISSKTLSLIENDKLIKVKKTIYQKLVEWLI